MQCTAVSIWFMPLMTMVLISGCRSAISDQQVLARKMGHGQVEQHQADFTTGQEFHDLAAVRTGDECW